MKLVILNVVKKTTTNIAVKYFDFISEKLHSIKALVKAVCCGFHNRYIMNRCNDTHCVVFFLSHIYSNDKICR